MKKLLIAAVIVLTQVGGAWAQSVPPVPKKFQGHWVTVQERQDRVGMKVDARTIDYGGPGFKETIRSIEWANEDATVMRVRYRNIEWVWHLTKVNGRETLIWVNGEDPTSLMVTQRAR